MKNRNIKYETQEIEAYYKNNRSKWSDFYPSEQHIFETIDIKNDDKILDIGCGCGGLGNALKERFGISDYTGIDIHEQAIATGQNLYPDFKLQSGDILSEDELGIERDQFDIVISLGCLDFNLEFDRMLAAGMSYLKRGGTFVASVRITDKQSLTSMETSYQYVNFQGKHEGEKAPYVIMNYQDLMQKLKAFKPSSIKAYGYMGKPSTTAITPYDDVCFSVFAVTKGPAEKYAEDIDLPQFIKSYD